MPLDATEIALAGTDRAAVLDGHDPLSRALVRLVGLWTARTRYGGTPILYDVVPVARLLDPAICSPQPMRVMVDDRGDTMVRPGRPDLAACLQVDAPAVLSLLRGALAKR